MTLHSIRSALRLKVYKGQEVKVRGKRGIIRGADGLYLWIEVDGETKLYHPTGGLVEYNNSTSNKQLDAMILSVDRSFKEMGIEVFPVALLDRDKWDEVVVFLKAIPIPPRRKKEIIVEWTKAVGAVLTEEMVKAVLGELAKEV